MKRKKKTITNRKYKPDISAGPWNLAFIEFDSIEDCLNHHGFNRTHSAKALGISLRTLKNKLTIMRSYGYEVDAK